MELAWRDRIKNWTRTTGVIVDCTHGKNGYRPLVEYEHNGERTSFWSDARTFSAPRMGRSVSVIYDPKSQAARHYHFGGRWGHLIVIAVGAMWVFGSAQMVLNP